MSFAIITDSTSDISPARAQELGIYVIPLHVIIEGEDLLDQVQITAQEYVARMAGSEQLPHTSQPSAGEFKALFDRVLADGHDSAIFISLCSEWSACYSNACLTAETHELDVRCIDSRTGSGAEGLLVEYALAMREDGRSLDETEAQIRAVDGVADVNAPYEIINGFQTVQKVLNIASAVIIAVLFVVACFVSMAMGTSVGTITLLAPIAVAVSASSGFDLPLCIASVMGGAMFGDNLSFISDTTIAACSTQGTEMKDKFRANFKIALPAALAALVLIIAVSLARMCRTPSPVIMIWCSSSPTCWCSSAAFSA